jgi:hypothetical protein
MKEEMVMNRLLKFAGMAVLAGAMLVPAASAAPQRFGFRGGFGPRFYGPTFYYGYGPGYYGGYGFYGPGVYGLGWYEPYGFVPGQNAGKVKFDTKMKEAQVYVDGGLAGTVKQLGTFPLRDGAHDIELRSTDGHTLYQEHVDVIAGKTIKIKV